MPVRIERNKDTSEHLTHAAQHHQEAVANHGMTRSTARSNAALSAQNNDPISFLTKLKAPSSSGAFRLVAVSQMCALDQKQPLPVQEIMSAIDPFRTYAGVQELNEKTIEWSHNALSLGAGAI
jgi:hypothetical protein